MPKNITYLLGAGASMEALPIVSGLNHRLHNFNRFLEFQYGDNSDIKNVANGLLLEIKSHATVDTYAKKLFLQKDFGFKFQQRLLQLKIYLSLFFIAEQSDFYMEAISRYSTVFWENDPEGDSEKKYTVDPRYDAFLATLLELKDKSLYIPNNINFISWNYDSQFEMAYQHFAICGVDEAIHRLNIVLPNDYSIDKSSIIKLNGTASIMRGEDNSMQNFLKDRVESLDEEEFIKLLHQLTNIKKISDMNRIHETNYPLLKFAWERDEGNPHDPVFESAKLILEKTNILVIIGYSFPTFNRNIDRELLKHGKTSIERIYYQAREKDLDGLIVRLNGILPRSLQEIIEKENGLVRYNEVGQFCIPFEI